MIRRFLIVLLVATMPGTAQPVALMSGRPTRSPTGGSSLGRSELLAAAGFRFPLPAPVVVLTPFDPPDRPWGSGHRGVDLAGSVDVEVRAAGAGEVIYAGPLAGRGVVSVQHLNGLRTTYEPVDPAVSAGTHVEAGQVLGRLAAGHPSCAPAVCLHWGARTGPDAYVDPMLLVTGWRVRLLPWDGLP
jgi:murein DD-endopeptidase MepM/ murein hydrolase activator NlpD